LEEKDRTDYAALCEALASLPPAARRRLVEEALLHGYAAKDLAEVMGVSPPAVSRYTRGSLAPSVGAVCRLLMGVDPDLRSHLLIVAARSVWRQLTLLLENMPPSSEAEELLAEIADIVSERLAHYHLLGRSGGHGRRAGNRNAVNP